MRCFFASVAKLKLTVARDATADSSKSVDSASWHTTEKMDV